MDALGVVIIAANVACLFIPGNAFWPLNLMAVCLAVATM